MPLPSTNEQLIIDGITGNGTSLLDVAELLGSILTELIIIRTRAQQAQLPPAAVLINEFMMRSDLDNGAGIGLSIYGRDFQIDPEDPEFPPALEPIHAHPRWPDPAPPAMSWQAFIATLL